MAAASDAASLSGTVLGTEGVAVAAAHVRLMFSTGNLVRETLSDQQGRAVKPQFQQIASLRQAVTVIGSSAPSAAAPGHRKSTVSS